MIIGNNANAGTVYFNTAFDTKSYNKNIKNTLSSTENAFSKTFGKIGKTIALALSVTAISKFTKSCIDLGSDLAEVQNVVDVVFPNINSQVNNFAKNAIDQFGLSELATKKYMGAFGAMSKSFGFSEKSAFEMSKTVTGLVGDVASFYNISQDLAYTKLKSVWSGETETLKDLGIVMTQTALNEYALRNGFSKTIDKMTEAEKVSLRYSFVQSQLASATGDFARTSDGWANQVRVLSLRFDQLKASLGQGFINLFTPIVKCLNLVISKLQVVADGFSKFTSLLFGKQQQAISNTTSQYDDLGSSAIQSAGDIASASKKAQKAVMGYDKLNILTNTKNDSSNGESFSSGASISTPAISTPTVDDTISPQMQKIVDKILSYIEPLKNISFENLIKSLGKLKDAFLPFAKNIFEGLEWGYFNILIPLAKFTIEDVIPTFLDLLSGALKVLNPILTAFKDIFNPIWDNLLKPLLSWTGGAIIDVLKGVADTLQNIGNWMNENQSTVEKITIAIGAFFAAWKVAKFLEYLDYLHKTGGVLGAVKKAIEDVNKVQIKDRIQNIKDTITHAKDFLKVIGQTITELGKSTTQWGINTIAKIKNKAVDIVSGIKEFLIQIALQTTALVKSATQWVIETGVKAASTAATVAHTVATTAATTATWLFNAALTVLTSPITLVIGSIALLVAVIYILIKHWDDVKAAAGACWDWIVGVWNGACEWFNATIIQPLGSFFTGMWDGLTNGASQAWEGIKSVFSSVASFFGNIFGNAWQTVKNVFSMGGKIFDGIKDGIVNAFKTIVNAIIKGINKVVSIPFEGINSALKRIKDINILGAKPFSWMPTIKAPQIPQLAEGAWFKARNPQLVMVGEGRNNEIVAPEPKLDDAIERGFKKYGNSGNGAKEFYIILEVRYEDGKKIIKKINDTQIQEGKILLDI